MAKPWNTDVSLPKSVNRERWDAAVSAARTAERLHRDAWERTDATMKMRRHWLVLSYRRAVEALAYLPRVRRALRTPFVELEEQVADSLKLWLEEAPPERQPNPSLLSEPGLIQKLKF